MMAQQGGPDDQIAQNMADAVVEYSMRCMKKTDKVSPFEGKLYALREPSSLTCLGQWGRGKRHTHTSVAKWTMLPQSPCSSLRRCTTQVQRFRWYNFAIYIDFFTRNLIDIPLQAALYEAGNNALVGERIIFELDI